MLYPLAVKIATCLVIAWLLFAAALLIYTQLKFVPEEMKIFNETDENASDCRLKTAIAYTMVPRILYGENDTRVLLKSPEKYVRIAEKCEDAMQCYTSKSKTPDTELDSDLLEPCQFFIFYHSTFANCASQLISKIGEPIACISMLFDEDFESDLNRCLAWDSSQKCLISQIVDTCDEVQDDPQYTINAKEYYYARKFEGIRSLFCMSNMTNEGD